MDVRTARQQVDALAEAAVCAEGLTQTSHRGSSQCPTEDFSTRASIVTLVLIGKHTALSYHSGDDVGIHSSDWRVGL